MEEKNSINAGETEKAVELSRKISSIVNNAREWEHHPGDAVLLGKLLNAIKEVRSLLYKLGLIDSCDHLRELPRKSGYRVNRVLEVIFEFIEADEEKR